MKTRVKDLVLRLLKGHRVMTIATNRPDGWPQAPIVGYVNDGHSDSIAVPGREVDRHLETGRRHGASQTAAAP